MIQLLLASVLSLETIHCSLVTVKAPLYFLYMILTPKHFIVLPGSPLLALPEGTTRWHEENGLWLTR